METWCGTLIVSISSMLSVFSVYSFLITFFNFEVLESEVSPLLSPRRMDNTTLQLMILDCFIRVFGMLE